MEIEILGEGAFESALIHLDPGEQFVSESGAMYRASANVDIDVTTRSRGSGGLLGGVKRLLARENFFFSTYSTNDGQPGEVGLAPTHQGEVFVIDVDPSATGSVPVAATWVPAPACRSTQGSRDSKGS